MPNAEAPMVGTLSPSDGGSLLLRRTVHESLRAQWTRRRRLLAAWPLAVDLAGGAIAIAAVGVIANFIAPRDPNGIADRLLAGMPVMLLTLIAIGGVLGLYRPSTGSLIERFRLRATATLLFVVAGMLMGARHGSPVDLVTMPFVGAIALVLGSWIEHLTSAWLGRSGHWGAPAVILGTGPTSRTFARLLMSQPAWGLKPVGFIEAGPRDRGNADEPLPGTGANDLVSALPLLDPMNGRGESGGAEVVIVPDCRTLPRDPNALYWPGVRQILVVNQLGDLPSLGLHIRHFDRFVGLELGVWPRRSGYRVKRAIDLAVALTLGLLAAPMIAFLALLVRLMDPGPAFYRQQRVGQHGKPIQVLKLRTMYRDAEHRLEQVLAGDAGTREQWQRYFKLSQDPRILPHIGHFLRRTSLDELPQLWNVIRGDMSLVGPRPFPAYHMDAFDPEFRTLRATVPPGLTGLWQISSRSNGDLGVQQAQDCFYIRNRSLWLDLYILIATLPAVIAGQGAK